MEKKKARKLPSCYDLEPAGRHCITATAEYGTSLQKNFSEGMERIANKKLVPPDVRSFCEGVPTSFILGQIVLFSIVVADQLLSNDGYSVPTVQSILPTLPPVSPAQVDALLLLVGAAVAVGVASHSWHSGHCTPCLPTNHHLLHHSHHGSRRSSMVDQTYSTKSDGQGRQSSTVTEERILVNEPGICDAAVPCISHCNALCEPCLSSCRTCLPSCHRESHHSISVTSQVDIRPGLLDYLNPRYWLGEEPRCGSHHRRMSCHTGFFERCNPCYWMYGHHGHHGHHHHSRMPYSTTSTSVVTETYDDGVVQSTRQSRLDTKKMEARATVPFKLFAKLNPLSWFDKKSEDGEDRGTSATRASSHVTSATKVGTGFKSSKKSYATSIAENTPEENKKPSRCLDAFRDDGLKWLLVLNIFLLAILFILFLIFPHPDY